MNKEDLMISIVIPTRNEKDIPKTLEACLATDYDNKEILVVDDSTDNTPEIIRSYADRGVRLIHRKKNENGCCGARNLGMQEARGDIIVLLNGDATPKRDFFLRISEHYQKGADFLVVRSIVKNQDNIWGNYKHSESLYRFAPNPYWTEGFSCRKDVAKQVGYIPGDFPVPFCRDYMFGQALQNAGLNKHIDMDIEMEHIWPDNVKDFWRNQVHRGAHAAPTYYFFKNQNLAITLIREALKIMREGMRIGLVLPLVVYSFKLAKYSRHGYRDMPCLFWANVVDRIAISVGNVKGVIRIIVAKRKKLI